MKSKHTKKALLMSVLSMLMCMAMLVGSTFAWFTDSVTSGNNKIVAGNLDIELNYQNASMTSFAEVKASTEDLFVTPEGAEILWEPGAVAVSYLELKNAGSLALKYKLSVDAKDTVVGEDGAALSQVLKTAVVEIDKAEVGTYDRAAALEKVKAADAESILTYVKEDRMTAKDETVYLAMIVYFPEEVGNEQDGMVYNRKDVELKTELSLNVAATQMPFESDSFGENYDEKTAYPILSQQALKEAIDKAAPGDTVFVGKLDLSEPIVLDKDITLKGVEGSLLKNAVIQAKNNAAVTIEDIGFTGDSYIHNQGMSALTMSGCDIDVNVPEKVNNGGRAAFISLGAAESAGGIKLDIRNNSFKVKSNLDAAAAAVFGWAYVADGSVISGNTFGSADSRYTFIAVKLMNFTDKAVVDISDNTVYGTTKLYGGFYAFDMYQNNSRANAYTAVFANNTIDIEVADPGHEAIFVDLESNGAANATIRIAAGNTFNGQPVTESHILIENSNAGTVEFVDIDTEEIPDPFNA